MKNNRVPPAPQPSLAGVASRQNKVHRAELSDTSGSPVSGSPASGSPLARGAVRPAASISPAPLDAAFLCRTYVSTAWFGALWALVLWSASGSALMAGSFAGGVALGALLLKAQEWFVRRALVPHDKNAPRGLPLKSLAAWIFLPLKYFLVVALLAWLFRQHLIHAASFAGGFVTVQIVIAAKMIGRALQPRVRSVRQVYIEKTDTIPNA